jgi:hypothetical protein
MSHTDRLDIGSPSTLFATAIRAGRSRLATTQVSVKIPVTLPPPPEVVKEGESRYADRADELQRSDPMMQAWMWRAGLVSASVVLSMTMVLAQQTALYYCPMHPDVTSSAPAACVRCAMALVPGDPYDLREYLLDVEMAPRAPRAGQPVRLRFTVRHPSTRAVVHTFATVHEKPFHLFVISRDLETYDHIHPEEQPDGSYVVDATLPRAGDYRLFADFLPLGGAPQVISRVITTAGFKGDLLASHAPLAADSVLRRTVGDVTVSLTLPEGGLVAGREETLRYQLEDARTGAPITDLEPYLGAFGHALVMSGDTMHYVHAHPTELLPHVGADEVAPGGPSLTFKALLPKPGPYRVWTQIKRRGEVSTVPFTVSVDSSTRR